MNSKRISFTLLILLAGVFSSTGLVHADKAVFEYSGTDDVFTVPEGVTEIRVKAWGAGGGSETSQVTGGPGGYTEALIPVQEGDEFLVVVGQAGTTIRVGDGEHYKFVGASFSASQGGSMSGVFMGTEDLLETDQERAVVIAGGGGGSIQWDQQNQYGGSGNAPSAGACASDCIPDSMRAGLGTRGFGSTASGGSGYRGGGEDMDAENLFTGGSGFVIATALEAEIEFTPDSKHPPTAEGELPPNTDDPDYLDGVGMASEAGDGHGLVVIEWEGDGGGDGGDPEVEFICHDNCTHELEDFSALACVKMICTADSPAEFTATLIVNGQEFTKTKVCDKTPPVCTATFANPSVWRNSNDFPIECELETYIDSVGDTGGNNDGGGNVEQEIFEYTGADQTFTVPAGVTEITIKAWGAGGGSDSDATQGGPGGYTEGTLAVTPGDEYLVVVGQGGTDGTSGGGYKFVNASTSAARGGSLSGVFDLTTNLISTDQDRAIIVAGGGGGSIGGTGHANRNGGSGNAPSAATCSNDSCTAGDMTGGDSRISDSTASGGSGYNGGAENATIDLVTGGSGFAANAVTGVNIDFTPDGTSANPPNQDDPDYIAGVGVGAANPGNGLVVISWQNGGGGNGGGGNAQCLLEPGSVTVIDPLEKIHGDTCTLEVCDKSGNCSICESPPLKYDDTDVCTAGTGLGKSADGVCGQCPADDDDCLCIKGDASKCRDDGPVNCYTNPFHDRCPGFQNPACLIDPFTPGCPVVNPCYPTPVYDGVICPRDAIRFCARNPYHYGCNVACESGAIDCDPVPPEGN